MEKRIAKVRKNMQDQGIDGLFLMREANIRYISGFTGGDSFVLLTPDHQMLITDSRYTEQAEEECVGYEIVQHRGSFPTLEETMVSLTRKLGLTNIGFERDFLTFELYDNLSQALVEKAVMVPTMNLVEAVRFAKDAGEVAAIKKAAAIADETFTYILDFLKPGAVEREIALELEYQMKKRGATAPSFPSIIASGPRGSLPHASPSDRLIQRGELVTLDFGALYDGYCSDMTRTVAVGEPSKKQRDIYELVQTAQEAGVRAIKAGVVGWQVDKAARDIIEKVGFGPNFGHGLGHGVGLEIHESPALNQHCQEILALGSVVTVEPGVYLPDWGGVRIEDTVVVTKEGCEILTLSTKELIILDA